MHFVDDYEVVNTVQCPITCKGVEWQVRITALSFFFFIIH
jgi:hypothetical protein